MPLSPEVELNIRKDFSNEYENFKALVVWVENMLRGIDFHHEDIYGYKVRIKKVDSLIDKINKELEKDEPPIIENFEHVKNHMKDIVGARIMVYLPCTLRKLHSLFMDFERVKVCRIKVHYNSNQMPDDIQEILNFTNSLVPIDEEPNNTGYTGVHFILNAVVRDKFYETSLTSPYKKYELQIRTIMQHAWSEIQHKVVYKSDKPDYESGLPERFASLAEFINLCDKQLSSLAQDDYSYVITSPNDVVYAGFDDLLSKIKSIIKQFEDDSLLLTERMKITDEFLELEKERIQKLSGDITIENAEANLEIAELYLKSDYLNKAYDLYKQCLKHTKGVKHKWALFRFSETCDRFGKKEEAKSNIKTLNELLLKDKDPDPDGRVFLLYGGAGYHAWKHGETNNAIQLTEIASRLAPKEGREILRCYSNEIYYKLSLWDKNHTEGKVELSTESLDKMQYMVDTLENELDSLECKIEFKASMYDTLAWYFFWKSRSAKNNGAEAKEICRHLIKADIFMNHCFESWNQKERKLGEDIHRLWRKHNIEIRNRSTEFNCKHTT